MNSDNQNLNIAVVQMSSSADVAENLQQTSMLLKQAADQRADLVLLPENVLCHGSHGHIHGIAKTESEWSDVLQKYSLDNELTIAWGGIPVKCNNDKLFNMSLVIDPTGKIIAKYAKNHLFAVKEISTETDLYTPGTEKCEFQFKGWRIALSICFDIRFPEQYDQPDLILCSAAFSQPTGEAHWKLLCRTRAVENQCYLAAANQHTTSKEPFPTFGHSMLINPWGDIMKGIETKSGIISSRLNKQKIIEIREKMPLQVASFNTN